MHICIIHTYIYISTCRYVRILFSHHFFKHLFQMGPDMGYTPMLLVKTIAFSRIFEDSIRLLHMIMI